MRPEVRTICRGPGDRCGSAIKGVERLGSLGPFEETRTPSAPCRSVILSARRTARLARFRRLFCSSAARNEAERNRSKRRMPFASGAESSREHRQLSARARSSSRSAVPMACAIVARCMDCIGIDDVHPFGNQAFARKRMASALNAGSSELDLNVERSHEYRRGIGSSPRRRRSERRIISSWTPRSGRRGRCRSWQAARARPIRRSTSSTTGAENSRLIERSGVSAHIIERDDSRLG